MESVSAERPMKEAGLEVLQAAEREGTRKLPWRLSLGFGYRLASACVARVSRRRVALRQAPHSELRVEKT